MGNPEELQNPQSFFKIEKLTIHSFPPKCTPSAEEWTWKSPVMSPSKWYTTYTKSLRSIRAMCSFCISSVVYWRFCVVFVWVCFFSFFWGGPCVLLIEVPVVLFLLDLFCFWTTRFGVVVFVVLFSCVFFPLLGVGVQVCGGCIFFGSFGEV